MKNKILTFILVVAMVLSVSSVAMADGSGLPNADNGVITLTQDVALNEAYNVSGNITIEGNGKTITWADGYTGTLFKIASGGSLTLNGVTIDGGNDWSWKESADSDKSSWYSNIINAGGTKELTEKTFIVDNGSLVLKNSTVKNCVYDTEIANYNDDCGVIGATGGSVELEETTVTKVAGTVVTTNNTTLTLNGTNVTGNYGYGNKGGLFIINDGTAVMENTSIENNRAWVRSGVIFGLVKGSEFTMNSGSITSNVGYGGAYTMGSMICIETGSKFVMNGGSITDNTGVRAGAVASRWVTNDGYEDNGIYLNGGTISGNTTKKDVFGEDPQVFVRSNLYLKKQMSISGNVIADQDSESNGVINAEGEEDKTIISILDFGIKEVGYTGVAAQEVTIKNTTGNDYNLALPSTSDYNITIKIVKKESAAQTAATEPDGVVEIAPITLHADDKAIISINPVDGLGAGNHDAELIISRTNTDSNTTPNPDPLTVKVKFAVTAPSTTTSTGSGISLWYNGGNNFGSSKSAAPTSVEIDGMPVSFTGDGSNFTVSCVKADAKWITVRWNSTTVTANFTPDRNASCVAVAIPKTGDMPLWAAIAEFFGF